jgi:hypothetical protein
VAVQQHGLVHGLELGLEGFELTSLGLAGQELLEQQRAPGDLLRALAQAHDQQFVAQGQEARRLQANDGDALLGERQQALNHLARLGLGLVHHAGGEEGAAAAEVLAVFRLLRRHVHGVAGGLQHLQGRVGVLGFEIAVEGVDEEHHGLGGDQHFSRLALCTGVLKK